MAELATLLDASTLAERAAEARRLLSQLAGTLRVHLAMEDKALYPRLTTHANERLKTLASRYADEMGGIHDEFATYVSRWPSHVAIARDAEGFVAESKRVFAALSARIDREDTELYPLVDETD